MKKITTFELFEEGKAFKATKKPFDREMKRTSDTDKRQALRDKVESHVKSQGCAVKQIGNDFEIHFKGEHIAQAMFRVDYVGIKKVGKKYVDEFEYTQLGDIKKHLTAIIKDYKEQLVEESKLAPEIKAQVYASRQKNKGKTTAEINKENVEKANDEREEEKENNLKDWKAEQGLEVLEENVKTFKELLEEGKLAPEIKAQVFASRQKNKGKTTAEINKENVEKVKAEREEPKKEPKKEEEKEMVEEGVKMFKELFGFNEDKKTWIYIEIQAYDQDAFIKNTWMDTEVNRKLMISLNDKLDLGFNYSPKTNDYPSVNKISINKINDISEFLTNLGLKKDESNEGNKRQIVFKGKLSLNSFKIKESVENSGDKFKKSFKTPTEPELPFKRKLTADETKKMNKYFPTHSFSSVDAKGRIILGGGMEKKGKYYITENDLKKLD